MSPSSADPIHVIGAGLAGSEAAWQIARRGVPVILHEMRPHRRSAAHQGDGPAELVCSNSFRSDDPEGNAVGLLHEEMRRLGSVIMSAADATRLPAGGALAVDRDGFSHAVMAQLASDPMITWCREEITEIPAAWSQVVIATGPLTAPALSDWIGRQIDNDSLAFFDAIAPIVYRDSINFERAWFQSRYDKGGGDGPGDYINCPLEQAEYERFLEALLSGETVAFHEWEKDTPYFEGCLPVEVMAARGPDTLRFGPMKPVGLTDPKSGRRPYAVVQLRQDNSLGTLFNMVGFQTKLSHGAQKEVFRLIPGLEQADFARLGGLHRNTFINSRRLLDPVLRLKSQPRLRFAGQITGVEGYVESAAIGLLVGLFVAWERQIKSEDCPLPPPETALGALLGHITTHADAASFQPMNVNFGLMPPLEDAKRGRRGKAARKQALALRARDSLTCWLDQHEDWLRPTPERALD